MGDSTEPDNDDLDLEAEAEARRRLEEAEARRAAMEAWRRERDAVGVAGAEVESPGIPPGRATAEEAKVLPGDGRRGPEPWN